MSESVSFNGANGRTVRATWFAPPSPPQQPDGSGVLLIVPAGECASAGEAAAAAAFAEHGLEEGQGALGALLLEDRSPLDRDGLTDLDRACDWLTRERPIDPERIAIVGAGPGGTRAFLFGCHSRLVVAAVLVDAPVVYAALGPERPAQPLELALNLSCPLLALRTDDGDEAVTDELRSLERVLSQFARDFDIVAETVTGSNVADVLGNQAVRGRVLSFLTRVFAEA